MMVVVYVAKIRIFQLITTVVAALDSAEKLSYTLQRYEFFS